MWFFSPLPFFTYLSMMSPYTSAVWGIANKLASPGPWNGLGKLDISLTPQLLAAWGPLGKAWCGSLPSQPPGLESSVLTSSHGWFLPIIAQLRGHRATAAPLHPHPPRVTIPQTLSFFWLHTAHHFSKLFCLLVSLFTVTLSPVEISAL